MWGASLQSILHVGKEVTNLFYRPSVVTLIVGDDKGLSCEKCLQRKGVGHGYIFLGMEG